MSSFFYLKAPRLLLAIGVSAWMAGGCLLGCANGVMAAEVSHSAPVEVVSGGSCHATMGKPTAVKDRLALAAVPRVLPGDCPLVTNATAVTSKNSSSLPEPGRAPVLALPRIGNVGEQTHTAIDFAYLPNRGPTHLRCCVFLI